MIHIHILLPLKGLVLMLYLPHDIVLYITEQILLLLHNDYTFFLEGHLPAKPNKIQILMIKKILMKKMMNSIKIFVTSRHERDRNFAARDDSAGPTNKQTILSPSSLKHVRHNLPMFSLSISFVTINIVII